VRNSFMKLSYKRCPSHPVHLEQFCQGHCSSAPIRTYQFVNQ
jgi:hypothetical protein